jgi:integration host factor subunit alpha
MLKKSFTRKELCKEIYKSLGFYKNLSSEIVDDFFDIITSELIRNGKIKISSFGTFEILTKKERIGRNPKTKQEAKISARRVVKFKPSLSFKNKLNTNEQ